MTLSRSNSVDLEITRLHHCISRCLRQSFLLAEHSQEFLRNDWLDSASATWTRSLQFQWRAIALWTIISTAARHRTRHGQYMVSR